MIWAVIISILPVDMRRYRLSHIDTLRHQPALLHLAILLSILAVCFLSGCAGTNHAKYSPGAEGKNVAIHVALYGGHSGIIIGNEIMPDPLRRLITQFNDSRYVEFGWGDEDFYRDPDPSTYVAVKAALWPTDSVVHVIGINEDLEEYAAGADIYRVELSKDGYAVLVAFIAETFTLDSQGGSVPLGPDPAFTRLAYFYKARPKFFFPRTCNTWSAKGLQKAGVPISPWANICVKNLAGNMALYGKRINL